MQISTRCAKRNSKDSGELSISRVAMRKRLHTKTEVLVLQGTPPKSDVNHRKTAPWRVGGLRMDTGQGRQVEERTPHCASNCKARSPLIEEQKTTKSDWVFAGDAPNKPILGTNLAHMPRRCVAREKAKAERTTSLPTSCFTRCGTPR